MKEAELKRLIEEDLEAEMQLKQRKSLFFANRLII